jgi:hypothetical protein
MLIFLEDLRLGNSHYQPLSHHNNTMSTEEKGKRQTTTPERVQIIEKHAAWESGRQIAKELDISKSEAQKIIHD